MSHGMFSLEESSRCLNLDIVHVATCRNQSQPEMQYPTDGTWAFKSSAQVAHCMKNVEGRMKHT
jgi:hypothetical protein